MQIRGTGILITGASRGLGQALANELAALGGRVVLVARTPDDVHEAANSILARGRQAFALAYDVSDKDSTHKIAAQAQALAGPINIVIHCASTLGPVPLAPLLQTECEDFQRALETNVLGPFRLTKALAGSMELRKTGLVAFISSDAAVDAYPSWGAYGASKAAADHMARTFAHELQHTRVLVIDPGEMNTKMHSDAMPNADTSKLAKPITVARKITTLIAGKDNIQSGSRLTLHAGSV